MIRAHGGGNGPICGIIRGCRNAHAGGYAALGFIHAAAYGAQCLKRRRGSDIGEYRGHNMPLQMIALSFLETGKVMLPVEALMLPQRP